MSHNGCSDHECTHRYAHADGAGPDDYLFAYIDHMNVVALNDSEADLPASRICKPWNERNDNDTKIASDVDDQIIIRIPFTGSVKLRCVMLKCGPGDQTPAKFLLYANDDNPSFSDLQDKSPLQEFDVPESQEIGEYIVKTSKFSNISSLTLFFPSSQGADNIQVSYIGLIGTYTKLHMDPVITVFEAQANPADHPKIPGLESNFHSIQ